MSSIGRRGDFGRCSMEGRGNVMNMQEAKEKYGEYVVSMRRYFHEHPEVSTQEYNTSKVVKEELDKMGVSYVPCGLETGVLATIEGGKPGKTILIRGDMDALSVTEETGLPYESQNPGVMHACGHDCHTSMLLTATKILKDHQDEIPGTVKIAFQPAEEVALGAKSMVENGALEGVDGCFSMHVWSDYPTGTVGTMPGTMMAAADQFKITVKGKSGHGSAPHQCVDAVVVTAQLIQALQTIPSRMINPMNPIVVTVGKVTAGERWNVIAGKSVLEGTIRLFDHEDWEHLPEIFENVVKKVCDVWGADYELEYSRLVPPTVNDPSMVSVIQEATRAVYGDEGVVPATPVTGGEDFAEFMERCPGAACFLGVRNEACDAVWPQHSNHFCVDEDALIGGAMVYVEVVKHHNAE